MIIWHTFPWCIWYYYYIFKGLFIVVWIGSTVLMIILFAFIFEYLRCSGILPKRVNMPKRKHKLHDFMDLVWSVLYVVHLLYKNTYFIVWYNTTVVCYHTLFFFLIFWVCARNTFFTFKIYFDYQNNDISSIFKTKIMRCIYYMTPIIIL